MENKSNIQIKSIYCDNGGGYNGLKSYLLFMELGITQLLPTLHKTWHD